MSTIHLMEDPIGPVIVEQCSEFIRQLKQEHDLEKRDFPRATHTTLPVEHMDMIIKVLERQNEAWDNLAESLEKAEEKVTELEQDIEALTDY